MGVIGERRLQELCDHAEFEVRQGTPRDIASRAVWEKCAEALERQEQLEERVSGLEGELKDAEKNAEAADERCEELDEKIRKLEDEAEDEKRAHEQARIELKEAAQTRASLERTVDSLTARLKELEPAGEERAALIERVRYLEAGLGRVLVEAFKLRKGVL